jgi:hypothetical protein
VKFLVFLLLFVSSASATIPTVCGSGIGTVAKVEGSCPANHAQSFDDPDLCFLLCADNDKDRDGFIDTADCDDTDPMIFPNMPTTKGCGAGEHRVCQSDGSYTSCTSTPLCEATGSGSCYYIDVETGSDSNSCTFASPCRNLTKFMGAGVDTPVSGAISLTAGDAVYLMGNGTITQTNTQYSDTATFLNYGSGTLDHPIRILGYPGSNVTLSTTGTDITFYLQYPAQHWVIRGLRATNNDGDNSVFLLNGARNVRVIGNYVFNSSGGNENNHSAYYLSLFTDIDNVFYDVRNNWSKNYRWNRLTNLGAGPENVAHFLGINKAERSEKDIVYKFNRAWDMAESENKHAGWCYKKKHGNDLGVNTADGGIQFSDNFCINAANGINTESSYSLVSRNIIWNVERAFQANWQVTDEIQGVRFLNNTTYSDELFAANYTEDWTKTGWEVKNNIHISRASSYGSEDGIYRLFVYGSGSDRTAFLANDALDSDNNCYYNEDVAGQYNFFSNSGGGGLYNFAAWKTALGVDANSFEEDPELDSYYRAISTNCAGKGWYIESGDPEPTPTPTLGPASGVNIGGNSPWLM